MRGTARCLPHVSCLALIALVATPGCSRFHFRERADKDVEGVISQKNIFPDWQVKKDWYVYPHPQARFADPSNPDRPPYPPDDFAARVLSPNPQRPTKKSGVGRIDGDGYVGLLEQWDAENRAADPPDAARGVAEGGPPRPTPPAPLPVGRGEKEARGSAGAPLRDSAREGSVSPLPFGGGGARSGDGDGSPARKHSLPPGFPGATASKPGAPAAPAVVQKPHAPAAPDKGPVAFSGWSAAPAVAGAAKSPEPGTSKPAPPSVILVSGKDAGEPKTVPAGGTTQPPPVPTPDVAPAQPLPLPEPKKFDQMTDLYPPGLTAGDPARDYLKALESVQTGYRLKIDQAVELGLVNAREYQDRREDLYLAALPVTLERFNFAAQALFTEQVIRESTGRELASGGERWTANTTAGVSKRFPTGALLLVRLANQVVIDLSGDRPQTSVSNLSLSLAQPFLRGGGYAVSLEPLAQSERTLLYAMRSYARFRKIFYVAIAAGGGYTNNPYGLQGLSANLGRGIGNNLTALSVGYLPLLSQLAVINNQRKNVVALERLLRLYQAYREGGQQSDLQVGQVEVQLLNGRSALINGAGGGTPGIRQYLDSVDNFKLQLGLPVTVGLELDDTPLRPIRQQLTRFEEVYAQLQQLEVEAARYDPDEPPAQVRARWRKLLTDTPLVRGTRFARAIAGRLDSWAPAALTDEQLTRRTGDLLAERRKLLDAKADRLARNLPEPAGEAGPIAALTADIDLGDFERLMRAYEAQRWRKLEGAARLRAQAADFRDAFNAFYLIALEARNDRLSVVRGRWPELPPLPIGEAQTDALAAPLDEAYTAAIQTALSSRLDLMNARGQVVDAWRQIAVQANSLQGVFDVRYDLAASTPVGENNAFGFSADRSRHQLTFRAELPFIRRAERNNYRAALIAYQRQRRTLMAFEDNIANDVRGDLRELRTQAELYRIQQRVVELGYSQVDNAQAILLAPPDPTARADAGSAAALTQQLLDAQSRLVGAQNNLYQLWVAYQTARMQLYLDLEQMTLDDRGVWIDEYFNRAESPARPADGGGQQPAGERLPAPQRVAPGGRR